MTILELIKVYSEINNEIITRKEASVNHYFIEITKTLL
jgi:hypothetical protein